MPDGTMADEDMAGTAEVGNVPCVRLERDFDTVLFLAILGLEADAAMAAVTTR